MKYKKIGKAILAGITMSLALAAIIPVALAIAVGPIYIATVTNNHWSLLIYIGYMCMWAGIDFAIYYYKQD
ncbi:MAG: hypothetical protein WC069_05830 [Candidatus Shapirobacteria bacterium]